MAKLYFYYASMNAGKSTMLLQADFNYRERGMETMLYTAAVDDRSGTASSTRGSGSPPRPMSMSPRPTFARGRGRAQEAPAPLHPGRRGAVPDPRPGHAARLDLRRARHPGPRLRPEDRLPGQSVRGQRRLARARRQAGRAEGDLRMRAQGDDEPARRRGWPAVASGAQTEIGGNDRYIAFAAAISWSGSPRRRRSSCA